MTFDNLGLSAAILRAVAEQGYTQPTPVQAQSIPVILAGRDILAGAQTGTGKTAGFTLPLLQLLSTRTVERRSRAPRALILTPTRELAAQVAESVQTYGKYLPLRSAVIFGGVGMQPQVDALTKGIDILVATPGRLLDHAGQKNINLGHIEILVLDEADRMLDMGFIHDIKRVLALMPKQRQNLLFSATYSEEIRQLAENLLSNPECIEVARRNTTAELVSQVVHRVDRERKRELLSQLIRANDWRQVLVFTRTKHGANRLAEQLDKDGITSAAIHGNKSQGARTRALADFKSNAIRVLVATDIAARGLDIDQLPHVVNYELPQVAEDYVHRIGRTGRAGASGEAVSLVCVDELKLLADIQRLIKRELPVVEVEGFAHDPSIKAEPIPCGGRSGPRPARNAKPAAGRQATPRSTPRPAAAAPKPQSKPESAGRRPAAPAAAAPVAATSAASAHAGTPGAGPRRPGDARRGGVTVAQPRGQRSQRTAPAPNPGSPQPQARMARPEAEAPKASVRAHARPRREVPALLMGRKATTESEAE